MLSRIAPYAVGASVGAFGYWKGLKGTYLVPEFVEDSPEKKSHGPGTDACDVHIGIGTTSIDETGSLIGIRYEKMSITPKEEDAMWKHLNQDVGKPWKTGFALWYISSFSAFTGLVWNFTGTVTDALVKGYGGHNWKSYARTAGVMLMFTPMCGMLLSTVFLLPAFASKKLTDPRNYTLGFKGRGLKREDPTPFVFELDKWNIRKYEIRLPKGHPLLAKPLSPHEQKKTGGLI